MTAVQLFLMALDHLLHSQCLTEIGGVVPHISPGPVVTRVVYGGNCWDAIQYAGGIHGWVVWL